MAQPLLLCRLQTDHRWCLQGLYPWFPKKNSVLSLSGSQLGQSWIPCPHLNTLSACKSNPILMIKISKRALLVKIGYAVTSFYCLQSSLMSSGPRTDVERGTVTIISYKVSSAALRTSKVNSICLHFFKQHHEDNLLNFSLFLVV